MKASRLSAALLLLGAPAAAEPSLVADPPSISTGAPDKVILRVEPREAPAGAGRARRSVGLGTLFEDKAPLNIGVWGGGGAVIGSLAGPPGAMIGAGAGALAGLLYSIFVVPHNGPEPKPK